MLIFLLKFLIRVSIFGIAIAFATRQVEHVKVTPRKALPLVALVFALLNSALYWLVSGAAFLITPFLLWLLVPFIANALLLWATDRLVKQFSIEGFGPLLYTSGIVTIAHFLLRIAHL